MKMKKKTKNSELRTGSLKTNKMDKSQLNTSRKKGHK